MTNESQHVLDAIKLVSRHVGILVKEVETMGVEILDACEKSVKAVEDFVTKYPKEFLMSPKPVSQSHVKPPRSKPAEKAESEPIPTQPPLAEKMPDPEPAPESSAEEPPARPSEEAFLSDAEWQSSRTGRKSKNGEKEGETYA
jgi:hypothetical protein